MAKKIKKNYDRLFMWVFIVLLALSVVIFNTAQDYWKVFTFLPLLIIVLLGLLKNKHEEKEKRNKSLRTHQQYRYPKK